MTARPLWYRSRLVHAIRVDDLVSTRVPRRLQRVEVSQPWRSTPRNSAASAERPVTAPQIARPARDRLTACANALAPESAATRIFTNSVVPYSVVHVGSTARMFQTPVTIRTAYAGHASIANLRAT